MGNVMVIPARRQVGNTVKQSAQKKFLILICVKKDFQKKLILA
jgi:hypothetical protein